MLTPNPASFVVAVPAISGCGRSNGRGDLSFEEMARPRTYDVRNRLPSTSGSRLEHAYRAGRWMGYNSWLDEVRGAHAVAA
jgi:hypothetical protein